jgi:glycosyltransferase involved in cell wall biosynthesis
MVIAPLEIGNEFCEAKSELKFFDAALSGTPIAASETETFRNCIAHGVNGFLAKGPTDWSAIFEACYMDPQLLRRCGEAARETAASRYSISAQTDNFDSMLREVGISEPIPKRREPSQSGRTPNRSRKIKSKSLSVLLPDIMIGSGGHRKVLTFCREYVRMGGKVEICFLSGRSDSELQSIVHTYYYSDCGEIRAYNGLAPASDVAVATSWPTAYEVSEWDAPEKYYFVQDFEPLFNPMSSDYAQGLHSYRLGLRLISFGRWNAQKLKHDLGLESAIVDFPLDHEVYFPTGIKREKEILFYARPSQPRRLYELGLAAIDIVRPFAPDWRFTFYGEPVDLQGRQGIESLGRITDLGELSRIYSQAGIGIAFSTTNPSLVPFEMLGCGLPVVDVELGYDAVDFDGCTAIVKSEPVPKQLARTLLSLIRNEEGLSTRSREASEWARKLPSEAAFGRSVIQALNLV